MKQYWLVIYLYRRRPGGDWDVANEVHGGTLLEWFIEQRGYESQEFRLLNAIRLTEKDEVPELKELLA